MTKLAARVILHALRLVVLKTLAHDTSLPVPTATVVRFGIVTDVHYADADPVGMRFYRHGLPKLRQATRHIAAAGSGFVVELGDFKDTDASPRRRCDKRASERHYELCTNLTLSYLRQIESTFRGGFPGPRYHLFGNHDVDVLNQTQVADGERDGPVEDRGDWPGVFSWTWPPDTTTSSSSTPPLRFVALNGDFTSEGFPWQHLDFPSAPAGDERWDDAHVPPDQLAWLEAQLDRAAASGQRVIVFIHFRLDGGPDGPVGRGLGPPLDPRKRAWIDACTLRNAAAVRRVLEERPGLVLGTFSGHDHQPEPPWTHLRMGSPVYWTHAGMVEGGWPGRNAYSVVTIDETCAMDIRGFADATSYRFPGPLNCTLSLPDGGHHRTGVMSQYMLDPVQNVAR